jgi:nitrogen fixation protein NifU and related proteins
VTEPPGTAGVDPSAVYHQRILDHYRAPRHRGELADASVSARVRNPTCGDEVTLQLRVESGVLAQVRFQGEGCSISQAAASMMASLVEGRTADEALEIAGGFSDMMEGDADAEADPALGDLRALAGVSKFPVRIRCALLAFEALRQALGEPGHEVEPGGSST